MPVSPSRSCLRAEGLHKCYRRRCVVQAVDLCLHSGEVVGLLGPNGAGKTTSFYMIVGLVRPDQGRILLDEQDMTDWPMYRRALAGVAYLPQEASVFRKMTVRQNLLAILEYHVAGRQQRQQRLEALLSEFRLEQVADSYGYALSGGERRRTEIARALVIDPRFILLDEPFAGIDPLAVNDIQILIAGLKSRGIGVLISDHNVRETLGVCDRACILSAGTVLEQGTPEQIATSERAREIYLGQDFRL
ncbi:MAG: LPS export ABC transporter ATP-binding protein [Desulfuromonas thiophila]|jgi:lipopolysaccharide export system ATP-binding protein|nr:LPS export ABC transporter ATP-binding protein [Desulfuromonas thiophila]